LPYGELVRRRLLIIVTPIHPASYATLMTIPAADIRSPIVTISPIAVVPIGTIDMAVVAIGPITIAVIPIGTMGIAVVAVSASVIPTAICTPLMSAVDASNAPGC
jgi:hypothetical protein